MNKLILIVSYGLHLALACLCALWGKALCALCFMVLAVLMLRTLSLEVRRHIGILAVLLLASLPLSVRADGPTTNQLFLTWDVLPDYSTNDTFYVYSSTNVAQPVSQWPSVTNVTFKQFMVATNVAIPPATDVRRFYTFVSSNFTGRSDFAEPDSCRRLPSGSGTRIGAR